MPRDEPCKRCAELSDMLKCMTDAVNDCGLFPPDSIMGSVVKKSYKLIEGCGETDARNGDQTTNKGD